MVQQDFFFFFKQNSTSFAVNCKFHFIFISIIQHFSTEPKSYTEFQQILFLHPKKSHYDVNNDTIPKQSIHFYLTLASDRLRAERCAMCSNYPSAVASASVHCSCSIIFTLHLPFHSPWYNS